MISHDRPNPEEFLDFSGTGLFAYQVDQLDDDGLRGADGLGLDQRRLGKPEALEQLDTEIEHELELLGRFHLLGHQFGFGIGACKFHQRRCHLGLESLHVELDERGQRQPLGIAPAQNVLVERQTETSFGQRFKKRDRVFDVFGAGAFGQCGHFQHHFIGVDQLQVTRRKALMRAVDEDDLRADQGFGIAM